MRNFFIIHGSFGDSREHYLPWLKQNLEKFVDNMTQLGFTEDEIREYLKLNIRKEE